jgi:hypothetical protein
VKTEIKYSEVTLIAENEAEICQLIMIRNTLNSNEIRYEENLTGFDGKNAVTILTKTFNE